MTTFYFIRHGQTTANALGLKQGIINDAQTHLNTAGQQEIQRLHQQFDISFADRIVISPLDRARETASILNEDARLPLTTDQRVNEISYGSWDGQPNAQLEAEHPSVFDPVLHDVLPDYVQLASDGEQFSHVRQRVDAFMHDAADQYPDDNIIVVSHGFTIKAAAVVATSTQDMMSIPEPDNSSVTKITLSDETMRYYLWYYNRFNTTVY
ncbi:histidine phosphatase family protein [Lacticaseibacillus thailandensis]|uniref:Phosphoglycerate mutase n=1 Tax=Lacticaseibacillus thailandensis DSM 22698 = JCM 13996 TaxID=1423810 RepID=A0A0R2CFN2_9LACO|nr:histidine phosphatase family protein [Lacticaseibacillus thailandensis]KRM87241.1 phosphoglycerate mutase [Lacticaseibacillus thailandensis DSM 22698 = JCM 13996]